MADAKLTALTEDTAPTADDYFYSVTAPATTPASRFVKGANMYKGMAIDSASWATNLTISTSRAGNAETIALKTKAGTDPSATDPIFIAFRNSTAGTGDYTLITITAATSITINSTATMGATNNVPFRLWLVGFNDSGTFRLGVINCLQTTGVYQLRDYVLASSTAISTAADNAAVIYTGTAVTTKAMRVLGFLEYTLATVGTWVTAPSKVQLYEPGVTLPGNIVQVAVNETGASATGATQIPRDDTIPQITEGTEFMTQAITPTSTCNLLRINVVFWFASSANQNIGVALFQDSTANALAAVGYTIQVAGDWATVPLMHKMQAATVSSTTFRVRAGPGGAATITFNGTGGARSYGGVGASSLEIIEIMA